MYKCPNPELRINNVRSGTDISQWPEEFAPYYSKYPLEARAHIAQRTSEQKAMAREIHASIEKEGYALHNSLSLIHGLGSTSL